MSQRPDPTSPLPLPRTFSSRPPSIFSNISSSARSAGSAGSDNSASSASSSGSGSGSITDTYTYPSTATLARRASASSHQLLSRPGTAFSFSLLTAPTPTDTTTVAIQDTATIVHDTPTTTAINDTDSILPSPSHSPLPPLSPSPSLPYPDSSSTPSDPHSISRISTLSHSNSRSNLALALASLPWAETPPRGPSSGFSTPLPQFPASPSTSLSLPPNSNGVDRGYIYTPGYAFLQDDPSNLPRFHHHSRASSVASSFGRSRKEPEQTYLDDDNNTIDDNDKFDRVDRADRPDRADRMDTPLESQWMGRLSGMADIDAMSSNVLQAEERSGPSSLSSAMKRLSRRSRSTRSTKPTKSTKSAKSNKSGRSRSVKSKRTSGGSNHNWPGRSWEVDMARLVEKDEGDLDLLTLAGRAAVLERLLRAGKRVSNSTIRLSSRLSTRRSRTPSSRHTQSNTPRTSRSLRQRLSRRLVRTQSRDDTFAHLPDNEESRPTGGVIVFPEQISLPPPPPLPPKSSRHTIISCLPPPPEITETSDIDYTLGEKEVRIEDGLPHQSPHLGHRSPGWKNRQSVISYLSSGVWDRRAKKRWIWSMAIGAGVILIIIIGLLVGLLLRRNP